MKDSSAKQPTVESSLCSPVAAPKKRKRQSGNAEIENFAMDFPFYCIFFFKFAYCCYSFICLSRKIGIIFIRHPSHPVIE